MNKNTQEHMDTIDLNLRLSPHFTLKEFTLSGTAIAHNIGNTPHKEHVERLKALCENVLEPLRRRFGVIRITSGYRCAELNARVGGSPSSQHMRGEAADINVSGKSGAMKMAAYIRDNLPFDQLLIESRAKDSVFWLHVSYRSDGKNRHECGRIMK